MKKLYKVNVLVPSENNILGGSKTNEKTDLQLIVVYNGKSKYVEEYLTGLKIPICLNKYVVDESGELIYYKIENKDKNGKVLPYYVNLYQKIEKLSGVLTYNKETRLEGNGNVFLNEVFEYVKMHGDCKDYRKKLNFIFNSFKNRVNSCISDNYQKQKIK